MNQAAANKDLTESERLLKLETHYEHQQTTLTDIKKSLSDINNEIKELGRQFSTHAGAATVKNKIWVVAYSSITVFATWGLHTFLFKYFGWEL